MAGRLLLSEKRTDDTLQFHYDTNGNRFSVLIGGERYLYVKNIQNDVVGLIDTDGNQVVEYKYDSWGNTVSITGSLASTVGAKNRSDTEGIIWMRRQGCIIWGIDIMIQ